MKKIIIILISFLAFIIICLLTIPFFIDVNKYKPEIEKQVSDATGREFRLKGEISLTLFPWAGFSLSGLQLGNPAGFKEKDFVSIKHMEASVKLIPLISKDIQIKKIVIDSPVVMLQKNKDGRGNWEGPEKKQDKPSSETGNKGAVPIKDLTLAELAIKNGAIHFKDDSKNIQKQISRLNFLLKDVSLTRPFFIDFSTVIDEAALSVTGKIGPIGKDPGKSPLSLDLLVNAFKQVNIKIKGTISDFIKTPQFDVDMDISPFSPRLLLSEMKLNFPIQTSDPAAITSVALHAGIKGTTDSLSISDGLITLDKSKLKFKIDAKDLAKPDLSLMLNLDDINLDGYLPPETEKSAVDEKQSSGTTNKDKDKIDFKPMRTMVIKASIAVGRIKVKSLDIKNIELKVSGNNGLFSLEKLGLKLLEGGLNAKGTLNVQKDEPSIILAINAEGIQVGDLLKNMLEKDVLNGTLNANAAINTSGMESDIIKKNLNGNGNISIRDGAIIGIDLGNMLINTQDAFKLLTETGNTKKTEFAELSIPYTLTNGIFETSDSTLVSPFFKVNVSGKADLPKENLDFRVEPVLEGNLDKYNKYKIPVLITGKFSSPEFQPDLKGMIKDKLEEKLKEKILKSPKAKKIMDSILPEKDSGSEKSGIKDLFNNLPFGK